MELAQNHIQWYHLVGKFSWLRDNSNSVKLLTPDDRIQNPVQCLWGLWLATVPLEELSLRDTYILPQQSFCCRYHIYISNHPLHQR
jgi:hypothetical protein